MKTLITLLILLVSTITLAQDKDGVTVTIVIENLLNDQGKVSAALYDEATFMRAAPLQAVEKAPENKGVILKMKNVKPGEYGIITLHDLNENGRMDFETSGMPKEPYGTSNNEMTMGPPNFADSKFTVADQDITLTIRM